MLTVVDADGTTPNGALIDEIVREGARRMLAAALEAEVNTYLAQLAEERDEHGRRLVVRNGYHAERTVATAAGPVPVKAPRVEDKRMDPDTRERHRFSSAIPPAWARKTPKISEVLPLLYLHGLSTGDFVPALEQFLGSARRDLSGCDYVYAWADGVHLKVHLAEAKACVLVLLGVRADGRNELITLDSGYRESGESWANLLRDTARHGMRAPVLAVGDGALGFWKALGEIWDAEDIDHARSALAGFAKQYGAKFPKAVAKLTDDEREPPAFYVYPAEHWTHPRTTNPIDSTFSTMLLRTKVTRGAGSRAAAPGHARPPTPHPRPPNRS
jgi:putative transposase